MPSLIPEESPGGAELTPAMDATTKRNTQDSQKKPPTAIKEEYSEGEESPVKEQDPFEIDQQSPPSVHSPSSIEPSSPQVDNATDQFGITPKQIDSPADVQSDPERVHD